MLAPLLTTKLYFPALRPSLVQRPRLLERLQAGLRGPLTLVSAPAGSGKTTLLSAWRAGPGSRMPVAWVSLEVSDNDFLRFFQYLSAALDHIQTGVADKIAPLLQPADQPNAEAILSLLINTLSEAAHDFALVLDDYHLIETSAIHQALTFLLDHLPPLMHIVLLTRADPLLPLARLRARGQLTEIRAADLRFNEGEAAAFLNQVMGLDLTSEQVAALEKRTEGWIAGLQLAALSMQGRADVTGFVTAFTGSSQYIVDYLVEEVLNRQPEEMREFLLKTAILERLTGPLCDALTEKHNGSETLEGLNRSNLFVVPLDPEQTWYRYHHLFAELLQSRLLHAQPQLAQELHNRASQWFDENGWQDEAINHAFAAREFERAARLICQNDLDVIYSRSITALERWLKAFPESFLRADPRLCIAKSHWLHASGRDADYAAYVQQAQNLLHEKLADGKYSEHDPEIAHLLGEVWTFQSLQAIARNDFPEAVTLSQKAVATIPETSRGRAFALGGLYVAYQLLGDIPSSIRATTDAIGIARKLNYPSMHATATYTLAQALRIQGRLQRAIEVVGEALSYVERRSQANLFYSGFLRVSLAESFYERNALDEMQAALEAGLKLCYQGGMNILCMIGLYTRIQLLHARGETNRALQAVDHIEHECRDMDFNAYLEGSRFYRAILQAESGETMALRHWLSHADLAVGEVVGVNRFGILRRILEALILLHRADEALPPLEKLEKIARQQNYPGWLIPIMAMQAVAWKQKENHKRALDCLEEALALAEPEGYQRVFINLGEPMRELLCMLQKQGTARPFIARLLAGFAPQAVVQAAPAKPGILSKREVELLALIAAGRSNKEIASDLVISIGTVKRHTVNIFTKLNVKNRTEAVAKARELGLL